MRTLSFCLVLASLPACGPPPGADEASAKLRSGDLPGAVQSYRSWQGQTHGQDRELVRALAMATLDQAFGAPSADVRLAAVSAAARLDDDRFSDAVSERLGDDDELIAVTAAAALLRSHPDAPAVVTRSLTSEQAAARAVAVDVLGQKVGGAARPDILKLVHDPDPGVRAAVADALGAIGADLDAAVLVGLTRDAAGPVRASALRALARLPEQSRSPGALAAARGALADPYLGARLAAIALLDRSWPASREDLGGSFKDPFTALRAAVIRAKRGLAAEEAPLTGALAARDPSLRQAGLNAVAELFRGETAIAYVRPLLRDPDAGVRLAAARALVRLDRPEDARPVFLQAVADGANADLRLSAATDLAHLGDARGLDTLVASLLDATALVRISAAETLLHLL